MELICSVQNYHWGKKGNESLVAKLALANSDIEVDENKPYAEFWMGTHPNGPSYLKATKTLLSQYLITHPEELGSKAVNIFGDNFPFLFKILSIEQPLSIQAHPTKKHAVQLHQSFPNIYKDGNHKPELAIAATKFEALCGFRPLKQIQYFLQNIPEFRLLIDLNTMNEFLQVDDSEPEKSRELMKDCFLSLMLCQEETVANALGKLVERLEKLPSILREEYLFHLVKRIHAVFPTDVGVFCVYWFNYIVLSPGEALYLAPNEPHAYLFGDCFECMANSDNVVRAGLTPKFRDIQTLCSMLTYKNYQPNEIIFQPVKEDKYCLLYSPPVEDFAVVKIDLPKNCNYVLKKRESASILLVAEGEGELNTDILKFGKVFFIPPMCQCKVKSNGIVMFQAFSNV